MSDNMRGIMLVTVCTAWYNISKFDTIYSWTSELQTLWDHVEVSAIGRCPLSAPGKVTTLSSRRMPRVVMFRAVEYRDALKRRIEAAKIFKKDFSTLLY